MTEQSIHDRIMSRSADSPDRPPAGIGSSENQPKPRGSWMRGAAFSVLGMIIVAGAGFGTMQIPAVRSPLFQSLAPAIAATNPELPDTPFLAHAKEAGIEACGTVLPVLGQLLTGGAQYNVQSDWNTAEPDKHAIRSLTGLNINSQDYSGPAAGIVFASPNGSGCEGTLIRIVPYQQACEAVVGILPPGSNKMSDLGHTAVWELANNRGQVLLLPSASGQSCVAISIAQAART